MEKDVVGRVIENGLEPAADEVSSDRIVPLPVDGSGLPNQAVQRSDDLEVTAPLRAPIDHHGGRKGSRRRRSMFVRIPGHSQRRANFSKGCRVVPPVKPTQHCKPVRERAARVADAAARLVEILEEAEAVAVRSFAPVVWAGDVLAILSN